MPSPKICNPMLMVLHMLPIALDRMLSCALCGQALTDANQSPTERVLPIALDMMIS
jgi:hypothetical protein